MVHGHQFGAVREGGLDLYFGDHLRDSFHDLIAGQQGAAMAHQFRHALTLPRAFQQGTGNIGDGFRIVEFQALGLAPFRQQAGGEQQQLCLFSRGVSSMNVLARVR